MPGLVVVNGALLTCNRLAACAQSTLTIPDGFMAPQATGQPVATINDHVVGTNIKPFPEVCLTTGAPCNPATPAPWTPGESAALVVSAAPVIAQSATLICTTGCGVITIVSPGQSMFEVYSPSEPEKEDDGGPFDSVLPALGSAARSLGGFADDAAGTAAAETPSLAGRVAGGLIGAIAGPLIFPEDLSDGTVPARPHVVHAKQSHGGGKNDKHARWDPKTHERLKDELKDATDDYKEAKADPKIRKKVKEKLNKIRKEAKERLDQYGTGNKDGVHARNKKGNPRSPSQGR